MSKRVLCLLVQGFEEIETVTPIDLLRRAGAKVVLASLTGQEIVVGRSQLALRTETSLDELDGEDFDLLLLPGGPGVGELRKDGRPAALAARFFHHGKVVAAICAAPTVLHDAGLLKDKKFTAHFSVHEELPKAQGEERVVEDGPIITSRGAGTAVDFGLALVRRLYGAEKADEIASAIMA